MNRKYLRYQIKKNFAKLTSLVVRRIYRDTVGDTGKSTLVVGSARSGTTWLANIIASQGKYRIMFEPFNPSLVPEYSKFNYFQYMRPDEYDQDLYNFCNKVFTGNIRNRWIDREIRHLHPQRRVIKCIRSTLMLRWMDVQFPEVPKCFIIRHPCAVVLSRMKLRWATDDDICHFLNQPRLVSDFLEDKWEVIERAKSDEEKHAIIWCITNLVPIQQFRGENLNVVVYEKLVRNPDVEIRRLFANMGLPYENSRINHFTRPSSTSLSSSSIITGKSVSNHWKNELSIKKIDDILKIVELMGLSDWVSVIEGNVEQAFIT